METSKKNFRKRTAILSFLRQTKDHPSAEMVFNHLKQEIPDLSLGTVYRNLSMFKAQGEIISLGTVNGVERFDGNVEPHVHFICSSCGCTYADADGNTQLADHEVSLPRLLRKADLLQSPKIPIRKAISLTIGIRMTRPGMQM